ncbi:MAG: TIGR00730 family Rossman fold protein [Elusimicrobiota bacterium]
MTRMILSALLLCAPALPAAAQARAAAIAAPAPLSASAAVAPLSLSAAMPAWPSPAASLLPPALSAPSSPAFAPLPALPAAAIGAAPVPNAPDAAAAPASAVRGPETGGPQPAVLHSLQDLDFLSRTSGGGNAGGVAFDGDRALFGPPSDPSYGTPRALPGVPGVAVKPVRGGLAGFAAHEVATVRKIQVWTSDLKVLVKESAATPDLVVNGVMTELKTVHKGKVAAQLSHANDQLLKHAKRHGLGAGAVALDVIGRPLTPKQIEAGIAEVVGAAPEIGFARVYVFNGEDVKTYAPAPGGIFRLDASAKPFAAFSAPFSASAASRPSASAVSFVPHVLSSARLPDMNLVTSEIQDPSRLLRAHGVEATVTMYGSARILSPEKAQANLDAVIGAVGRRPQVKAEKAWLALAREMLGMSKYYQIARELGALIAREGGGKVAVVTGGGPGIMEAGNRGAFEAGGPSVGYNIKLPFEQHINPYATPELEFTFDNFWTRKMSLRHGSMGLVYFPGGYGTMDELFEVLTLMQTGKMAKVPIVLIGERAYWDRVLDFDAFENMGLIAPGDQSLFAFAENAPQAWAAIRAAHAAPAVAAR